MRIDDNNELSKVFGTSEECLPLDHLLTALEGGRGSEAQALAEKHLSQCPSCEAELALFREFEAPEIRSGERADVHSIVEHLRKNSPVPVDAPWWKSLWNFKILAPAAFVAAGLLALTILVPRSHEPQPGSFASDDTLRSQRIEALSPLGSVKAFPGVLAWTPVKEARKYRVRLFEVDNTQLWATDVQSAGVPVPREIQKHVIPLKKLYWQVTAFDSSGNSIADSGPQSFMLKQPAPL